EGNGSANDTRVGLGAGVRDHQAGAIGDRASHAAVDRAVAQLEGPGFDDRGAGVSVGRGQRQYTGAALSQLGRAGNAAAAGNRVSFRVGGGDIRGADVSVQRDRYGGSATQSIFKYHQVARQRRLLIRGHGTGVILPVGS